MASVRGERPVRSPSAMSPKITRRCTEHPDRSGRDARSRAKAPAADRGDDSIEVGDLGDELEGGGAHARDHTFVVERMDLDRAVPRPPRPTLPRRASIVLSHSVTSAP